MRFEICEMRGFAKEQVFLLGECEIWVNEV